MKYIIQKINPLDLKPSKGIGINIPFNGSTGLNITYESKDAIRANIINFLLTGKRERIMNSYFGSSIRNQLFENIDKKTEQDLETLIYDGMNQYFPNVRLDKLEVSASPDKNTIQIYFTYSIINTNIEDDILININR